MATIFETVPKEVVDYVLDDYQDNVWYNGDEPAGDLDALRSYWDEYVADRETIGLPVPEGLTPELYWQIWDAWYNLGSGNNDK